MGKKKKRSCYERIEVVPVEIISSLLQERASSYRGKKTVSLLSNRILTYSKGLSCVHCNIGVSYFAVEKQVKDKTGKWHLNAYHLSKDGRETMMTSDHIIAVAIGGDNSLENRQVMCSPCNSIKAQFSSVEESLLQTKLLQVQKKVQKYLDMVHSSGEKFKRLLEDPKIPKESKPIALLKSLIHTQYLLDKLWSYQNDLYHIRKEVSCLNAR